jgi:hypothetical protein
MREGWYQRERLLRNKKNPKIPIVYFISKNPIHVERDRNINRKKEKAVLK